MSRITLSGAMPDEIGNGLAPFAQEFMDHDTVVIPVVAFVAVDKITRKVRKPELYPTLTVLHWEVVTEEADIKTHGEIIGRRLGARTGAVELPFEAGAKLEPKDQFPDDPAFDTGDKDPEE